MAIDYGTDVGRVRLPIAAPDEANQILDDPQISGFLALEGGNVKLAAAQALDAIASSEALISKKITVDGQSTDGPSVAKELRERASGLRTQVDEGVADDTVGLAIVDFDPYMGYLNYPPSC